MFGLAGLRLYAALGAAALLVAFALWVWRIDSLRAQHKRELVSVTERLKVSNATIKAANAQIADNNKRIAVRAEAFEAARRADAAAIARANERWERTRNVVASLEASAQDNSQGACVVSPRAREALEGL